MDYIAQAAIISECEQYRFKLYRKWDNTKSNVCFIGLNPSTADACKDDATIRRCVGYADSWGYGGLYMVNLFPFRATDPEAMKKHVPLLSVVAQNAAHIQDAMGMSDLTVAAWGNHGKHNDAGANFMKLFPDLMCLAVSKEGQPMHPLYLKRDLTPHLLRSARNG